MEGGREGGRGGWMDKIDGGMDGQDECRDGQIDKLLGRKESPPPFF